MPRVKGGYVTRQRRKRTLKLAKGYYGAKHLLFKTAKQQVMKKIFNFLYKEESLKIIWSSWWIYFYSLILTGLIVLLMKINHKIVVTSLAGISITYITVLLLYILIYKPKKLIHARACALVAQSHVVATG